MDLGFLKEIGQQLSNVWREIKMYQKFTVVLVAVLLLFMLGFLISEAATTKYSALYPAQRLSITDAGDIKAYLDSSRIPYELKSDTLILVPSDRVHRIRMDMAAVGLPKLKSGKGFELFDSNTWIKGEKELQILEMRALKGELENDIAEYENIKTASVILDIAPPRPFGGTMYKTKSSVILTLMPGARLTNAQLRAMTYHVAGAVRGLQPNMVAISDTTGKLYQGLDPNGDFDILRSAEIALEERLKSKVDGMLAMVVGIDNFYSTVQVTMNRDKTVEERRIFQGKVSGVELGEPVTMSITESGLQLSERERAEIGTPGTNVEAVAGAVAGNAEDILNRSENRNQTYRQMAVPVDHLKINSTPGKVEVLSIGVMVDKTIIVGENSDLPQGDITDGRRNTESLKAEIVSQLQQILGGYGVSVQPAVDFVEFDKTRFNKIVEEETWGNWMDIATKAGTVILVILVILGMFWTFNRFWNRHMMQPPALDGDEDEDDMDFLDEPSLVEVETMIEAIRGRLHNDPVSVADAIHEWLAEDQTVDWGSKSAE